MTQLITVENHSSLTARRLFGVVRAVAGGVAHCYNTSPWVTEGHAPAGHVVELPKGVDPPAGAWNLILLDDAPQQGELGYHDDENGKPIPYAEVFCRTAADYGSTVSAVACHEAFEMLVDPNVNDPWIAIRPADMRAYIVEVADPVQGNDFYLKGCGWVCDFAYPAWWGLQQTGSAFSYRDSVHAPFELAPQGYISWQDANGNWQQTFGEQQKQLPAWASRLPRVHGH